MTTFESKITPLKGSQEKVFDVLSDFNNLSRFEGNIPENDSIKNLVYEKDRCEITVNPVGKIGVRIIERIPYSQINLQSENSPIKFTMSINLQEVTEDETQLKIIVAADLNPLLKGMVGTPLQKFIDMLAAQIGSLPFEK
jgi:hypothetical protein